MHYHYYHFRPQNSLYLWLIIAGGLYAFNHLWKYIYGPFKIRQSQRQPGLADYLGCEIEQLPPHAARHFLEMIPVLAESGFVSLGCVTRSIPANNLESYVSLWVNQKQLDSAQIITIIVLRPDGKTKIANSVILRTEFTDDTSIVTGNSGSGGVFPKDPAVAGITVPAITNIAELYRLHRARVAHHKGSRRPKLAPFKDAQSSVRDEHRRTYERLINVGYYDYDAASDEYVPTMRGAFLMTYKMLTPFKQIQRWRKKRMANREMGLVDFTMQPRTSATIQTPAT